MPTHNSLPIHSAHNELGIDCSAYDAFLFDMDGTIIDNMLVHHEAWRALLETLGHTLSLQEVKQRIWGKNDEIFDRLFPGVYSSEEKRALATRKELMYIERYRPHIALLPGLESLLTDVRNAGIPTAIVTAAPRMNVDFAYEALELSRFFDAVVHADEVVRGKPDPEGYLLAAERLRVNRSRCLVFEDAPVGIRAAHTAGMDSYVVLTTHSADEFTDFPNIKGFINDFRGVYVRQAKTDAAT